MSEYPEGPWRTEVAVAQVVDLNNLWAKWTSAEGLQRAVEWFRAAYELDLSAVEVKSALADALSSRKEALQSGVDQTPTSTGAQKQSTSDRIDAAILQHLAATEAYASAVEESARLDAESKRLSARKFLEVKANVPEGQKRVTDSEANRAVDADEAVLEARLASDIASAQAKAAKARLDHWEHLINWGRSVYSRETRADTR